MLGMKCSDRNFNQKFDARNLNTIIGKSLKKERKRKKGVLNIDEKRTRRNTHTMDSQVRLTRLLQVLSLDRVRERKLNVPDVNVDALEDNGLCQTSRCSSIHWPMMHLCKIFNISFTPSGWNRSLRTYSLSCFDVRKHATQQRATPNCPPLLRRDSAVTACRTEAKRDCCFKSHAFVPAMTNEIGCKTHFPVTP